MESKYNLLTRLLKNIKNVVNPDGSLAVSGGGVLVVMDEDNTLDKTWQEIHDAMLSGGAVIRINETNVDAVKSVSVGKGTYDVVSSGGTNYSASSASGYPSVQAIQQ